MAHRAALSALRKEAEAAHEKATQSHGLAMETAAKERDDALRQYQEVHQQLEQFQESQVELQVDSLEKWLTAEASDVYDNDDAFDKFCELARANFTPEDAVKMVRQSTLHQHHHQSLSLSHQHLSLSQYQKVSSS